MEFLASTYEKVSTSTAQDTVLREPWAPTTKSAQYRISHPRQAEGYAKENHPIQKHITRQTRYPSNQVASLFVVKDPENKITEAVRRIVQRFRPEKIILFGSRARGDPSPDSDADLLVVMRVRGSRRRKAAQIDMALAGIGMPKDIIVITPEELERFRDIVGTVVYPAVREGKVLYDAAA